MGARIEGRRYRYTVVVTAQVEGENIAVNEAYDALRAAMLDWEGSAEPTVKILGKKEARVRVRTIRVDSDRVVEDSEMVMPEEAF